MAKVAIGLDDKDIQELNEIIMDKDRDEALKFLEDKIYSQVLRQNKNKLDVVEKTPLIMDSFYDNLKRKIFTIILKRIKGKKNILDIGCGSCELVFFLARELKNVRVVGVDLRNCEFPDTVEKRRKEKITNKVQCLKADASELNFLEDKSFDAVVNVYSLHEFSSPQKTLQEAFRVLHKEGKLIIVDFIKGTLADKLWGERYYTPERIKIMLENASFQNISSQLLSREGPGLFTGIKREGVENFNKLVDSYLI